MFVNKMLALDVVNLPVFTTAPVTTLSAASAAAAVLNVNNKVSIYKYVHQFVMMTQLLKGL